MIKSDSIKNIATALLKAQSEMGTATKGATNPFFRSKFADLNSIREASLPVLNKHGVSVLQPTVVVGDKNYIQTTLLHAETGEFLGSLTEIVVAKINDPQAQGSGQSYARRYGLQAFLCIGAEDDDGEKAMSRSAAKTTTVTPVVTATTLAVDPAQTPSMVTPSAVVKPRSSFRKSAATVVQPVDNTDDI